MITKSLAKRLRAESVDVALVMDDLDAVMAINDRFPRIAACGLVNAGKSSLLNALTDHLADGYFPTKAVRETLVLKELVHEDVTFVDTPGIDAPDADEQEAWRGIAGADAYIFVHNLRQPELDAASEVPFLLDLFARQPDAARRMLVVLSSAESVAENLETLRAKIATGFAQLCGDDAPPVFAYSFTTYARGQTQQKPELVRRSGLPELRERLQRMADDTSICGSAARDARMRALVRRLETRLEYVIEGKSVELASLRQRDTAIRADFAAAVDGFFAELSEKFSKYQEIA